VTYPAEIKDAIYTKVIRIEDRKYFELIEEEGIVDYWSQRQNCNRRTKRSMSRRKKHWMMKCWRI
jgi:hypothetical protein